MGGTLWIMLMCVCMLSAQKSSRNSSSNLNTNVKPLNTEVRHIGDAESKSVVNDGFFPSRQPSIYWHDHEWSIDLMIPPSESQPYSLSVRSISGSISLVTLPKTYAQIDSIQRSPGDKAVITADCGGTCSGFLVVDLKNGSVIDDIGTIDSNVSPNGRFVLFLNGHPGHSGEHENLYHLYDTLKTPRENVCGYMPNDPKHERLDDDMRGTQVYPLEPTLPNCSSQEDPNDDNVASHYMWADDSSKIAFVDVRDNVMSIVVVEMPINVVDSPKTLVYQLTGAEDVCVGSTDATGNENCDYHLVQSLIWEGESVSIAVHHQFGTRHDLKLSIPISRFLTIR
jgi:hypothetical protein